MYHAYFEGVKLTPEWRKQNLPEPIKAFMEKWQGIADVEMETYELMWPAKLVHTDFTYHGTSYRICPETFGIPDDLCERFQYGQWVEKKYGGGMNDDLRKIDGVFGVFSDGFLD